MEGREGLVVVGGGVLGWCCNSVIVCVGIYITLIVRFQKPAVFLKTTCHVPPSILFAIMWMEACKGWMGWSLIRAERGPNLQISLSCCMYEVCSITNANGPIKQKL
jgi:hypothetical protein